MSELKIEIERLENELTIARTRIAKLERFIEKKGFKIPMASIDFKSGPQNLDDIDLKKENEKNIDNNLFNQDDHAEVKEKNFKFEPDLNKNALNNEKQDPSRYTLDMELMTDQLKYERFDRIAQLNLIKEKDETIAKLQKENEYLHNQIEQINQSSTDQDTADEVTLNDKNSL